MLENSNILVTGGTGSFGSKFIPLTLQKYNPDRLVVFSRDEMKQWEMQKVYEEDLNIEPQTIFFKKPSKIAGQYITNCSQADLYVDRKDGRTRLRVRNFLFKLPPTFPELELVASIALNRKGFKKNFINRDASVLEEMINATIDDLLGIGGDDW